MNPTFDRNAKQDVILLASLSGGFAGRADALTSEAKEAARFVPTAGVLVRQAAKKLRDASVLLDMVRRDMEKK